MIATTPAPAQPKQFEGRCAHVDGEAVFSIGVCSSKYLRCSYGASKLQQCSEDRVFSNDKLECIVRESVSACTVPKNPSIKKYYTSNDQSAFCDGKEDGLYRNERDCSAILQVFLTNVFKLKRNFSVLRRRTVRTSIMSIQPCIQSIDRQMRLPTKSQWMREPWSNQWRMLRTWIFHR